MKVKLAILDSDVNYLKRLLSVFSTKYSDKLEVYSFTDQERAIAALSEEKIDVFVADEGFIIDERRIYPKCCMAYFVASADIEKLNDQPAICKYQKADLIYKAILNVFSERAGNMAVVKTKGFGADLVIFSSPSGGTGTSSVAAAYAARLAEQGKRALYLNLERFSTAGVFFDAEGAFGMAEEMEAAADELEIQTNNVTAAQAALKAETQTHSALVNALMEIGLMPEGSFSSEPPTTRAELALMLVEYLKQAGIDCTVPEDKADFADADLMDEEAQDAFQVLYKLGVFAGVGDGRMEPDGATTRAQLAVVLRRVAECVAAESAE